MFVVYFCSLFGVFVYFSSVSAEYLFVIVACNLNMVGPVNLTSKIDDLIVIIRFTRINFMSVMYLRF